MARTKRDDRRLRELADQASNALKPSIPLHILRDWLQDHGANESDLPSLEWDILSGWWQTVAENAEPDWTSALAEIVREAREDEDEDEDEEPANLGEVLDRETGCWNYKDRCPETYRDRWRDEVERLVDEEVLAHVLTVLGIDPNNYDPHWDDFYWVWVDSVKEIDEADPDDPDAWLS